MPEPDLVERLRAQAGSDPNFFTADVRLEAAAEIERLRSEHTGLLIKLAEKS